MLEQLIHDMITESSPNIFFDSYQTVHVVLIAQLLKTILSKKHLIKLDDITNNDVIGFGGTFVYLSADIIRPRG